MSVRSFLRNHWPSITIAVTATGVIDLARDRPPADRVLIATKASLVVRKDLHPAIQYLLLNTAREIHSRQSIFHRANEFPAAEADDIPLSDEAVRFYKSGPPFLHDYFPFWIAALLGKIIAHSDLGCALPDDAISASPL